MSIRKIFHLCKMSPVGEDYDKHYWWYGLINGFRVKYYQSSAICYKCSECGIVKYKDFKFILPPFKTCCGGEHFVNGVLEDE